MTNRSPRWSAKLPPSNCFVSFPFLGKPSIARRQASLKQRGQQISQPVEVVTDNLWHLLEANPGPH